MFRTFSAALLCLAIAHAAAAQSADPVEPSGTRLLVGPTGRALEQGQFYVDFSGFVGGPFVQVGITDRISLGAGTPVLIPGIRPGDALVVTPKVQVYASARVAASVGVLQFAGSKVAPGGIAYGVVTRGSFDGAITGGVGFSYSSLRKAEGARKPLVLLGGEKRISPRFKLISENYAALGGGLVSGGLRFMRGHGTLDLGVATLVGADHLLVAPIFRFAWSL